jgi:signal transduction histidine kinase
VTEPELLVAANRAGLLDTVLQWLLHDVRNPVQTLAFLPEIASSENGADGLTPDWHAAFDTACGRLGADLTLIDRLVASPGLGGALGPVDVGEVLGYLADLFATRRGGFCVDIEGARRTPLAAVAAVRRDLETALLNVLLNSVEASREREGRVTVDAEVRDGELELAFQDDGPGVSHELRGRLFEPFVTTKTDRAGRGLGLFSARHLLAASGGDCRHEPTPSGSRFVIRLRVWGTPGR